MGAEIFEDTKAWFVNIKELKIIEAFHALKEACDGGESSKDTGYFSKVYLDPKEADARLKEEVKKKAMNKGLTGEQLKDWYTNSNIGVIAYAIQQVEQQYGITYLTVKL